MKVTLVVQAFEIWVQDDLRLNRQISATVSKANKRFITSGDTKNSPTGELIQEGHDHASSIMSLFESRNHHVIFRKNNLDFWLETVYRLDLPWEESIIFLD